MTDIVERLRMWDDPGETICTEAADEIERLQIHNRLQAEDIMTLGQQVGKLEAEIERLRAALRQIDRLDKCLHPLCRSTQAAHVARDALGAKP